MTTERPAHPVVPVLDEMIDAHEQLLMLFEEHKTAIRFANGAALDELGQREQAIFERIGTLDARRRSLMSVRGKSDPAMTVTQLSAASPEPARTQLAERARKLRELIARAQSAHVAIKAASESLLMHLRGVVQQVGARLSHAGTYGRDGAVRNTSQVMTGLDVQS
ncbi:MAG: flagellar protein FlgN [Planctomycetota bacterium]